MKTQLRASPSRPNIRPPISKLAKIIMITAIEMMKISSGFSFVLLSKKKPISAGIPHISKDPVIFTMPPIISTKKKRAKF